MLDVKLRYKILLYFLSLWQILLIPGIILWFTKFQKLGGVLLIPVLILMPLHYYIGKRMSYNNGDIEAKYYK